jgi:PHS family inorganic phosphate transporter-like MFS transporter
MRKSLTLLFQVITAEFAPRKYRARMLSWVFFAQPVGQLLANVMSLAAVEAYKPWIERQLPYCPFGDVECFRAIDRLWRLVVGIGIIPAVIALAFRFTIPESPRYTLDILQNTKATLEDTANYYDAPELHPEHGQVEMRATTPQIHISRRMSTCSEIGPDEIIDDESESEGRPSDAHLREPSPSPQLPPGDPSYVPPLASWSDAKNFFITEGNWQYLLGTSLAWLFLDFACKPSSPPSPIHAKKAASLRSRSLLTTNSQQYLGETRRSHTVCLPDTSRQ